MEQVPPGKAEVAVLKAALPNCIDETGPDIGGHHVQPHHVQPRHFLPHHFLKITATAATISANPAIWFQRSGCLR